MVDSHIFIAYSHFLTGKTSSLIDLPRMDNSAHGQHSGQHSVISTNDIVDLYMLPTEY